MGALAAKEFTSLDDERFNALFRDFRRTAFRLETLQHYAVDYERDEFARFLAGERRGEFPGIAAWCETVRAAVAAGKQIERVHVVTEPLSDYIRFECAWAYDHTVEAGEDVRLILADRGRWPDGLPREDYWLFDSSTLVAMRYGEGGEFRYGEISVDVERIARARHWRTLAVRSSYPYRPRTAHPAGGTTCRTT